jgi:acyl carrier protein
MSDSIESRVRTVIARVLKIAPQRVRSEHLLGDDLGAGWQTVFEIALELERDYGLIISIDDVEAWGTVADIVTTIERALAVQAAERAA